jgi:hypothetical protein
METKEAHLLEEKENLTETKKENSLRFATQIKEMDSQIAAAELEQKELQLKQKDSEGSIQRLSGPLLSQIDSLKTICRANEEAEQERVLRIKNQILGLQNRQSEVEDKIIDLTAELELLNKLKVEQKSISETIASDIIDVRAQLKFSKVPTFETDILNQQLSQKRVQLKEIQNRKIELQTKKTTLEKDFESQRVIFQNEINALKKRISKAGKVTQMSKWSQLAKKCGELEEERIAAQKKISEIQSQFEIYNQTEEILATGKARVDQVKRAIDREKEYFKQQLLQYYK